MTSLNEFQNNVSRNDKKILIPLMFLPCLLIQRELNNDIWFLLNSGRYVMNYGIPHIEPFTIHSNMEFLMQQWLSSVLFWITYDNFGEAGLFILIMICYAVIVFLMYRLINLITNYNFFISFTFTIIFSILIRSFMITRPIIFTIMYIVLELYTLELFITYNDNKYLIVLPVISVFMINLQAAMWPIQFVMLLPYVLDSFNFKVKFISGQGYEKKFFIFAIIVMILVGIINPYGIKSMTYLFRSYGYPEISNTVIEMKPININEGTGLVIFSYILINILIYCFYRNGKTKIRYFLLTLGTGIMALSSYRNFSFFIIGSLIPLAYYLKNVTLKTNNDVISPKVIGLRKVFIISIVVVTLCAFFISNEDEDSELNDLNAAIDYILHNEDISNIILYTRYNDGGLTEFSGLPSYIDPRAEVFVKKNNNKDDIMKEYIDLQGGKLYYKSVLDKYNFSHLLVSEEDILSTYLPYDNNYAIIYSNESYKIFKKID
jgi:hypothetical protein